MILKFIRSLSKPVKLVAGTGILLAIYGYLCRLLNIYFFWESRFIGFMIFILAVIFFLVGNIKNKRPNDKHSIAEKIGIGILALILVTQAVMVIVIPNTDASAAVREQVKNDEVLKNETGDIESVSFIPVGGLSISSRGSDQAGEGYIRIIVKGTKKYKDLGVQLSKEFGSAWVVSYDK